MKRIAVLVLTIICTFGIFIATASGGTDRIQPVADKTDIRLNIEGFTRLLDLVDIIIARNPDYQTTIASLKSMSAQDASVIMDMAAKKNAEENPVISAKLDSLFNSPAYLLYYAQFGNVTPETHRKIFCNLPYRIVDAPGDIGSSLFQICAHRAALRTWVNDIVSKIDLQKCHQLALQWLPPGEYDIPTTFFLYDGNGDAFAKNGSVGFDLCGALLLSRPEKTRFDNLAEINTDYIERTLAHEFFHIYAGHYLYPAGRTYANWQDRALDNLVRGFVNEGVAMQCNPPEGFKRDILTDSLTIKFWVSQLNEISAELEAGGLTEAYFQQWQDGTFQNTAFKLLENYLQRKYPESELTALKSQHSADRPDLQHGLGWWMVSRITNDGKDKEKIATLLTDPHKLFALYNDAIRSMPAEFRVASH